MLLGIVGFTHDTLQQHLQGLAARGLVVNEKMASSNMGDPNHLPYPIHSAKQVTAALRNPHEAFVMLQFSRLRHVCRFEKGGN